MAAIQSNLAIRVIDHSSDPRFRDFYVEKRTSREAHFKRLRDKLLPILRQRLPAQHRFEMLDVGCNAGSQVLAWAELGHKARGLDVNAPLLEVAQQRAKERGLDAQFDLGTATRLPYPDACVDACILLELLEHVSDWQACLREAARVVRPGGLLYLSTTNAMCPKQQEFNLPLYSWYPATLKRHFEKLAVTTHPQLANFARYPAVNWFTPHGLAAEVQKLGFDTRDRLDMVNTKGLSTLPRMALTAARGATALRRLAYVFDPGTAVLGLRKG